MTPAETLAGIRDANYHEDGIRCLRLLRVAPDFFRALREEVVRLCERESPSNAGASDHVTNWTRPRGEVLQFSLFNASGRCDDFSGDHVPTSVGKRFHMDAAYPRLARFIRELPDAINVRVNVLGPRARLAAHEEHSIIRTRAGTIGVCARLHLPIDTGAGAELLLDGAAYHLEAGVVYFVNHGCIHAATNGAARRIHLVWDMLLTRDAYRVAFADGPSWASPVPRLGRFPRPLRIERMGAAIRLPPQVEREEAEQVDFCQPQ